MTQSAIQRILSELGAQPSRSLGQNFLHDQNVARWIVARLDPQPGDHIVEIGPGLGSLTTVLAETGCRLTLIEKDTRLIDHLNRRFASPTTRVVQGDALEFDLRELWGHGPVKVVGNLPYYVSTPLIETYTSALSPASVLVLTLQLELAQRLDARPGTREYGAMTVCVNRRWKAAFLKKLPPTVFLPAPKVDSAVVSLSRRAGADVRPLDELTFERIVRRGFSERRKQLKKLLPECGPRWGELTGQLGVEATVRGEELSLAQWEELAASIAPAAAQSGCELFDVVDEDDRVIRAEMRDIVHVNNLRHRAVHVVARNAAGEIYLQRRSIWKDRNPGRWDSSCAGHVDSGETYEQAARREFAEELGAECAELEEIGRLTPSVVTGWEFIEVYSTRHDGPFHPAPMEVETGAFFSKERIDAWVTSSPGDFSPVFLQVWAILSGARRL